MTPDDRDGSAGLLRQRLLPAETLQRIGFGLLNRRPVSLLWRIYSRLHRPAVYVGDHTVFMQNLFGHMMYLDSRDESLLPTLLVAGCWEPHVTRVLLGLLRPGLRVVDVGANVGYYTLLAASRVGTTGSVVAFEANPRAAELAQRALSANGFSRWARVVNMAVTDRSGTATLYRLQRLSGSSSLFGFDPASLAMLGETAAPLEVPATSLDAFFDQTECIDLLRMDVEGAEPSVLDGMQRLRARNPQLCIVMEFVPEMIRRAGRDPQQFLEGLDAAGFRIRLIDSRGRLRSVARDELLSIRSADLVASPTLPAI